MCLWAGKQVFHLVPGKLMEDTECIYSQWLSRSVEPECGLKIHCAYTTVTPLESSLPIRTHAYIHTGYNYNPHDWYVRLLSTMESTEHLSHSRHSVYTVNTEYMYSAIKRQKRNTTNNTDQMIALFEFKKRDIFHQYPLNIYTPLMLLRNTSGVILK